MAHLAPAVLNGHPHDTRDLSLISLTDLARSCGLLTHQPQRQLYPARSVEGGVMRKAVNTKGNQAAASDVPHRPPGALLTNSAGAPGRSSTVLGKAGLEKPAIACRP